MVHTVEKAKVSSSEPLRVSELLAEIRMLRAALKPFAAIVPSSFNAPDGSEGEQYRTFLAYNPMETDFSGADLARARAALQHKEP